MNGRANSLARRKEENIRVRRTFLHWGVKGLLQRRVVRHRRVRMIELATTTGGPLVVIEVAQWEEVAEVVREAALTVVEVEEVAVVEALVEVGAEAVSIEVWTTTWVVGMEAVECNTEIPCTNEYALSTHLLDMGTVWRDMAMALFGVQGV